MDPALVFGVGLGCPRVLVLVLQWIVHIVSSYQTINLNADNCKFSRLDLEVSEMFDGLNLEIKTILVPSFAEIEQDFKCLYRSLFSAKQYLRKQGFDWNLELNEM